MRDFGCFTPETIEESLATKSFGRHLVHLPKTQSTNDVAKKMARSGSPEGTLVVAEEQTAGRGRLGRSWLAPPGSSLLVSLVLRPPLPPESAFALTMLSATSVAAAVERVTGLSCGVKWPNDVFIRGRKVAGILSEMSLASSGIDFVVVGIGLNVNADLSQFSEIAATATSLSAELGQPVDRLALLCQLLLEMEDRYWLMVESFHKANCQGIPLIGDWQGSIFQEWRSRLITLGQWVTISDGDRVVEEGLALDVDMDGALLVRRLDGTCIRVAAGDVTLRGRRGSGVGPQRKGSPV